ncbi:MAG: sensor histidine kinase [Microbacteriaceae bacterium]|nr:MAG: sensor histidine kinase [Microbacteriaceae bacterium]
MASQILAVVLTILVLTVSLGALLYSTINGQALEQQYQLRALGIAQSVSRSPDIVAAVEAGDPDHIIRVLAEKVRETTGAAYVVVADREGIRYSHPNPALIGKRLEEGAVALDGKTHTGVDNGSLGRSANGIAPIFSQTGQVVGEVSVGILETKVSDQLAVDTRLIVGYSLMVLILSALGSVLLARRIKRVTFGLEPASIASLLQEREALLHGIREGMVGLDTDGRITVINQEAKRLLGLDGEVVGRALDEVVAPGRLLDTLTGKAPGIDETTVTDDFLLVVNHMDVELSGRAIGSVVTIRDRTEVEGLIREVHAINGLTEALRAQEHEYANHLFVITGLIEMGDYDQVASYVAQLSDTPTRLAGELNARIEPPQLAALLIAKITIATEHGVSLVVTDDSHLAQPDVNPQVLVTIVGNLIDNAIEALADQPSPREIAVTLSDDDGVRILVVDNGPGVPADRLAEVLVDGYSTKAERRTGMRRGLGLALVSRIVRRLGGDIRVGPGPGGRFEVRLPEHDPTDAPQFTRSAARALRTTPERPETPAGRTR